MNTYTKPLAIVSSILLSASFAGPVQAAPQEPTPPTTQNLEIITAAKIDLPYEKPEIKSHSAASSEPVAVQDTSSQTPAPVVEPINAAPVTPKIEVAIGATGQVTEAKFVETATPKVSASGKGASIAAAAYAQIGVAQDCTALVSNSLAAVGINFHGWPRDYMTLGPITTTPSPGDLIYYDNAGAGVPHIAVYVGNGMAIHGGWNGGTTALFSATIGSGPVYIDVA